MKDFVHVAVGVLFDHDHKILISKRPDHVHQGGKLEFPGGKLEQGESVIHALAREFDEELGVCIDKASTKPLIQIRHEYPDVCVLLDVWEIYRFTGEACGKEGQLIQWLDLGELNPTLFPEANRPIIDALSLPSAVMLTPNLSFEQTIKTSFIDALGQSEICILRLPLLSDKEYEHAWLTLQANKQNASLKTQLVVHGRIDVARKFNAPLHLTSTQLKNLKNIDLSGVHALSASVHTKQEQALAEQAGVMFTLLGSVQATQSHPTQSGMGWTAFEDIVRVARVPVYALGGMTYSDVDQARRCGGQGVAGISLFQGSL